MRKFPAYHREDENGRSLPVARETMEVSLNSARQSSASRGPMIETLPGLKPRICLGQPKRLHGSLTLKIRAVKARGGPERVRQWDQD